MIEIKHVCASKPFHILAKPGDIAKKVVCCGDPGRVLVLAELLEDAKLVNENRGFLTYTGRYEGVEVTVATHGIGAPSAAIVFEELLMLGAKTIVRFGSCGSFHEDLRVGSVVVAEGAAYLPGGTIGMYIGDTCFPAVPDFKLTEAICEELEEKKISFKRGIVGSSDAFHAEEDYITKWRKIGIIAVEMECALLFTLARLRGFRSASALIVVNDLLRGEVLETSEKKKLEREIGEAILKALVSF